MKFVTIDQMDRTDIERALDEAFKAVAAKGPIGHATVKDAEAARKKRHEPHLRQWVEKRLSDGWRQVDIARESGLPMSTVNSWARAVKGREAQQ